MAKFSCTEEELDKGLDEEARRLGPISKEMKERILGHPVDYEDEVPKSRLDVWVEIGMENPWIRQADDPVFDVDSFGDCPSAAVDALTMNEVGRTR